MKSTHFQVAKIEKNALEKSMTCFKIQTISIAPKRLETPGIERCGLRPQFGLLITYLSVGYIVMISCLKTNVKTELIFTVTLGYSAYPQ